MSRLGHRVLSVLLGLWFTVLTVEPARLHSCPTHDGVIPASHAAHGQHANHGTPEKSHACNCPGTCCVTAIASPPVQAELPVVVVANRALGLPSYERAASPIAYAIPFANGPPR